MDGNPVQMPLEHPATTGAGMLVMGLGWVVGRAVRIGVFCGKKWGVFQGKEGVDLAPLVHARSYPIIPPQTALWLSLDLQQFHSWHGSEETHRQLEGLHGVMKKCFLFTSDGLLTASPRIAFNSTSIVMAVLIVVRKAVDEPQRYFA